MAIVGRRLTGHSVGRDNRDLVLDIVTDDWHCRTGGIRPGLHRVRRGGVIDVAIATAIGINVGLGRRVARGIGPGLAHVQHAVRAERLRWSSECAEQWVADRHARERHVAGVRDRDRVGDHIPGLVDHTKRSVFSYIGHRLGDAQLRCLHQQHSLTVRVARQLTDRRRARGGSDVGEEAVVDVGLGDGVAAGERGAVLLARQERDRPANNRQLRIAHRHTGEGRVADVLDCEGVGDRLAHVGQAVAVGGLLHVVPVVVDERAGLLQQDRRELQNRHRGAAGLIGQLVAHHRSRVIEEPGDPIFHRAVAIEVGLRRLVALVVEPGLPNVEHARIHGVARIGAE